MTMTPHEALAELFDRVGDLKGKAAVITLRELMEEWPAELVPLLKTHKILVRSKPAKSAVCPGCEEACTMPVFHGDSGPVFVVCDKRSDIHRVPINSNALIQWQASPEAIGRFVAEVMDARFSGRWIDAERLMEIGIISGKKRGKVVCLGFERTLQLVVENNQLPLVEILSFGEETLFLDTECIKRMIDTAMGDPRYTPSTARREVRKLKTKERNARWKKAYKKLIKKHPNMPDTQIAEKIAKMKISEGRSSEYIRKKMKF